MYKTEDWSDVNKSKIYRSSGSDKNIFSKEINVGSNWEVCRLECCILVCELTNKSLTNNCIFQFEKLRSILTDHGKIFENKDFTTRIERMNIRQKISSAYQHQSNGLVDRVLCTVRDMIVTSIECGSEWKN